MTKILKRKISDYYSSLFFVSDNGYIYREIDIDKIYFNDTAPELLDISIIRKCNFNCPYCYMDSKENNQDILSLDDIKWLIDFFGEYKPYQVALGGGEPTLHSEFTEILKLFRTNDIIPNYTTNGLGLFSKEIIKATEKYCGGVALTYHPHRKEIFEKAINILSQLSIQRNIHIIVTHRNIDKLEEIIDRYINKVDTIVLLKFMELGRGINLSTTESLTINDLQKLKNIISKYPIGKIAVSSPLIPLIIELALENNIPEDLIQLFYYNPEGLLTGYIDENLNLAPSSYWTGEKVYLRNYNSFMEAYNSELFKDLRRKQYELTLKCKYGYICHGGIHSSCPNYCSLSKKVRR